MADNEDDQDDVPIHSRRQSRLDYAAPVGNARYSSYNGGGYSQAELQGYGGDYNAPPVQSMRESSYGGYTDSPHFQERYNNPFEQPAPQQDFDVMADFNNAGPRYSHLYGTAKDESMRELVKSGGRPITCVACALQAGKPTLTPSFHQFLSPAKGPRGSLEALPSDVQLA